MSECKSNRSWCRPRNLCVFMKHIRNLTLILVKWGPPSRSPFLENTRAALDIPESKNETLELSCDTKTCFRHHTKMTKYLVSQNCWKKFLFVAFLCLRDVTSNAQAVRTSSVGNKSCDISYGCNGILYFFSPWLLFSFFLFHFIVMSFSHGYIWLTCFEVHHLLGLFLTV